MRLPPAFIGLAVSTLVASPLPTYAQVGLAGSPRVEHDVAATHGGGHRELWGHSWSGWHGRHGGHHNKHDGHHNKDGGHKKHGGHHDHGGGHHDHGGHKKSGHNKGGHHHHRGRDSSDSSDSSDSKGWGTSVTGRSGGNRIGRDGLRIRCWTPDPEDTFVVDLVECHGDCCEDEDYCGEFKENLGTGISCEEDEDESSGWNCDFDVEISKDFKPDTTEGDHGYRVRITDLNDESFQACSSQIDIEPEEKPKEKPEEKTEDEQPEYDEPEEEEAPPCTTTSTNDDESNPLFGPACDD